MCLVGGNRVRKFQSCSVLTSVGPEPRLALSREGRRALAFSAFHPVESGISAILSAAGFVNKARLLPAVGVSQARLQPQQLSSRTCGRGSRAQALCNRENPGLRLLTSAGAASPRPCPSKCPCGPGGCCLLGFR